MMRLEIPGNNTLEIEHLVLDYNGTIAFKGEIIQGVLERLSLLASSLKVHIITADTYGSVHQQCEGQDIFVSIIGLENQDREKLMFIESLGASHCISIGNGKNDALMLAHSALGFSVIQEEGTSTQTLIASDVVFKSINDALDALIYPKRLIATLRN